MKLKIDRSLVPIKAHFFFFFAGLGPLLPQLNVYGRQLGVSPGVMGMVTSVLPLLWAAAKPLFGYVVDFWPTHRKLVFMLLITTMTGSYCCLWFLPMPDPSEVADPIMEVVYNLNDTVHLKQIESDSLLEQYNCHWSCSNENGTKEFQIYLSNTTFVNTIRVDEAVTNETCSLFHMEPYDVRAGQVTCAPREGCNLICYEDSLEINATAVRRNRREISDASSNRLAVDSDRKIESNNSVAKVSESEPNYSDPESRIVSSNNSVAKVSEFEPNHSDPKTGSEEVSFYMTGVFWAFVVLMCVGTVAFNVANCIGDAVCFDVLGPERSSKYGAQRAWGTAGYGLTALLGGWLVDVVSSGGHYKDFTPAFVVAMVATAADLVSCRALALPRLSSPDDSGAALRQVLKMPRVLVFIAFAIIAGTFDSFIIYYMFWFLEELAEETGTVAKIKLIEGVVVAAQSFIGELLFFYFSGKIIKRFGYGTTMTVSLFCYGVRMALISVIQHPWHLVFIEAVMQGPTYALCYSTIVGYAAQVAPEGYSATVQGIVAGMDDGVGFALGSLVGGQLYSWAGGRGAFRGLAATAVAAALAHALLFRLVIRRAQRKEQRAEEVTSPPEEGEKMLRADDEGAIYRETVVPLKR